LKFLDRSGDWKRRFALIPIHIGPNRVWLEPYWQMFLGDSYAVTQDKPKCMSCGGIAGKPVSCRHCEHIVRFYRKQTGPTP